MKFSGNPVTDRRRAGRVPPSGKRKGGSPNLSLWQIKAANYLGLLSKEAGPVHLVLVPGDPPTLQKMEKVTDDGD